MCPSTWLKLSQSRAASVRADLMHGGRHLEIVLTGLPLQLPLEHSSESVAAQFDSWRATEMLN